MIRRVGPGKYVVMSSDGSKKLSRPLSRKGAERRLAQVERIKHMKEKGLM
jgi:hypothetical protein